MALLRWLPQVEARCGGQVTGELKQGGGGIVEGKMGVATAGSQQGIAIVNQGAQVATLQSLVKPRDQDSRLGVLDPIITTAIHRQVMVTI